MCRLIEPCLLFGTRVVYVSFKSGHYCEFQVRSFYPSQYLLQVWTSWKCSKIVVWWPYLRKTFWLSSLKKRISRPEVEWILMLCCIPPATQQRQSSHSPLFQPSAQPLHVWPQPQYLFPITGSLKKSLTPTL